MLWLSKIALEDLKGRDGLTDRDTIVMGVKHVPVRKEELFNIFDSQSIIDSESIWHRASTGEIMAVADRKQREKEQRRTEIIDAAEKLFYKKGFDNVTMDEIAEAVEFSKGSLYVYFKNKDSLFFGIVARQHRDCLVLLEDRLKNQPTGGGKLRAIIQWYVDTAKANPDYIDMATTYGPLIWSRMDSEDEAAIAVNAISFNSILNAAIVEGIRDGTIRKDLDPVMLGFFINIISISVVSPLPAWKKGFALAGISFENFLDNFSRFIDPSIDGSPEKIKVE